MGLPTKNKDIKIAIEILYRLFPIEDHNNVDIIAALMTEDAEGRHDFLYENILEIEKILARAKTAIEAESKENQK